MKRSIFFPTRSCPRRWSQLSRRIEPGRELRMVASMAQRYISNKNESVRMFESGFMEFFSHVHPATPLVIYLPVIVFMLDLAWRQRVLAPGFRLMFFALGIFIRTFV